jgi:hypothetical protein
MWDTYTRHPLCPPIRDIRRPSTKAVVMRSLGQLEDCSNELITAINTLTTYHTNDHDPENIINNPLVDSEAPQEAQRARRTILSSIYKIKALLQEPIDLLEHLSCQVGAACNHSPSYH